MAEIYQADAGRKRPPPEQNKKTELSQNDNSGK
jgi:hypothetical protein